MTQGTVITSPAAKASDSKTYCRIPVTIVVFPPDITVIDQMNMVEASGTLDFWDDGAEDIYKADDGQPV